MSDINIPHLDVGQASGLTANTANIGSRCWTPQKISGGSNLDKKKYHCNFMSNKTVEKAQ